MITFALLAPLILASGAAQPPAVIVVVGAPGTPEYGDQFVRWADRWELAADRAGASCRLIGVDPEGDPSDRRRLETLLEEEPKAPAGPVWLVLIGHGTFDGKEAKFNLRGADVAAATLRQWLEPFERTVVVVNCASSSAPFINRLSAPNRVVVTATKSGYEYNFARFGEHLSAAIVDPAADLDKDEQTSLLEAFLLASRRVAEFYEEQARLATETALLDDNGDGAGTPADWFRGTRVARRPKGDAQPDGSRAHAVHLVPNRRERSMPEEVRARRDELQKVLADIRRKKGDVPDDEYYAQVEPILVELAQLYADLDTSPGRGSDASSVD